MNNCSKTLKTQKEIATYFGVGVATVRRWHSKGCPRVYVGASITGTGSRPRYDVQQVRAWLDERTNRKEVQA